MVNQLTTGFRICKAVQKKIISRSYLMFEKVLLGLLLLKSVNRGAYSTDMTVSLTTEFI